MRRALAVILAVALAGPALADGKPKGPKPGKGAPVHATATHCPPGLAKKNPPCVPPGLARKAASATWRIGDRIDDGYIWVRDPWRYGLRDPGTYWRVGDHFFRVDRETGEILAVLGALAALVD